jgi:riboflavin synthase
MFTGIVEETGVVESIEAAKKSIRLAVRTRVCGRDLAEGDSLAVNGCCLTATRLTRRGRDRVVNFDLLRETWDRTNFPALRPGSRINLERALPAGGRLGGHFVTGHIDGTGRITRWERRGADHVLDVAAPAAVMRYVIQKGSICVDGISLTVAGVRKTGFRLWIIPHTLAVTALRDRRVGDAVNLEADLLGKYVEQFLRRPNLPRRAK